MPDFDYRKWSVCLCMLVDEIEQAALDDDIEQVLDLCRSRLEIAESAGLMVDGPIRIEDIRVDSTRTIQ
jgi:hypothetical protein